jgi:hypothetical protein
MLDVSAYPKRNFAELTNIVQISVKVAHSYFYEMSILHSGPLLPSSDLSKLM